MVSIGMFRKINSLGLIMIENQKVSYVISVPNARAIFTEQQFAKSRG